jgi:hypothetical protein
MRNIGEHADAYATGSPKRHVKTDLRQLEVGQWDGKPSVGSTSPTVMSMNSTLTLPSQRQRRYTASCARLEPESAADSSELLRLART